MPKMPVVCKTDGQNSSFYRYKEITSKLTPYLKKTGFKTQGILILFFFFFVQVHMYRRQNNVTIAKSNLSDLLSVLNGRADIAHCSIVVVVAVFIFCFVLIFLLLLFFYFVFFYLSMLSSFWFVLLSLFHYMIKCINF